VPAIINLVKGNVENSICIEKEKTWTCVQQLIENQLNERDKSEVRKIK